MQLNSQIDERTAREILIKKENLFQRKRTLCKSELIQLSYYLFSAVYNLSNGKKEYSYIGVDTISGECAHINSPQRFLNEKSEDEFKKLISIEEAKIIANKFLINEILYRKKKRISLINIEIKLEALFEYPYWIGYFKRGSGIDFNVIDGLTGQRQGPKMKSVFIKYLMQ